MAGQESPLLKYLLIRHSDSTQVWSPVPPHRYIHCNNVFSIHICQTVLIKIGEIMILTRIKGYILLYFLEYKIKLLLRVKISVIYNTTDPMFKFCDICSYCNSFLLYTHNTLSVNYRQVPPLKHFVPMEFMQIINMKMKQKMIS